MLVAIVDYGSGNLRSAAKAFERVVTEQSLSATIAVTTDPDLVRAADRVVLPGVGAFADCLAGLSRLPGMIDAMRDHALVNGRPFLGICVGMQMLSTTGHEHGAHPGLDWVRGEVRPIVPAAGLKVPHMGWNELQFTPGSHPLLDGLAVGAHAYFVHSYQFHCADPAHELATVDYGAPIAALIAQGNIAGAQFHPEKSQATGLRLISNFLSWAP